jgi:hypothetical protein
MTDSSCGAHSIDVIGPLWYLKLAKGLLLSRIALKSQTLAVKKKLNHKCVKNNSLSKNNV